MAITIDTVKMNASVDEKLCNLFHLGQQFGRCWSKDLEGVGECVERCVAFTIEAVNAGTAMKEKFDCVETRKFANVYTNKIEAIINKKSIIEFKTFIPLV